MRFEILQVLRDSGEKVLSTADILEQIHTRYQGIEPVQDLFECFSDLLDQRCIEQVETGNSTWMHFRITDRGKKVHGHLVPDKDPSDL